MRLTRSAHHRDQPGQTLPQRSLWTALLLAVLLVHWRASPAAGQAGVTVHRDEATYQFGQTLIFTLEATAAEPVTTATILFSAPTLPNTFTAEVAVEPTTHLQIGYTVDLTQVRLAPFSPVTYRWVLTTEAGEALSLPAGEFRYEDDRFQWQQLGADDVVVHWAEGSVSLGQDALDTVAAALPRLLAIVPAPPPSPLHIYLYPTASDLQAALRLTGRSRVGGHASPELGAILVAVDDSLTASAELGRVIPHELSHLMVAGAVGDGYDTMPLWLNEGLATYAELTPSATYATLLVAAIDQATVIPFRDLCLSFPTGESASALAYAQSVDMVRYLQDEYGNHVLTEMVLAVADGAGCESVVRRVLDLSLAELNDDWWRARAPRSFWERLLIDNLGWLILIGGGFGFVILGQLRHAGKRREGKRDAT